MPKTNQVGIRVPAEIRKILEKRAAKEGRTLSNMILQILIIWLRGKGDKL